MNFRLFDPNHPFYNFMRKLVWVFVFNIIFLLTCFPIITIFPSAVGCAGVFLKLTDERQANWLKEYGSMFVRRLKVSLFYEVIAFALAVVLMGEYYYFSNEAGIMKFVGLAVAGVITVVSVVYFLAIIFITAKFRYGIRDTGRAAAYFVLHKLKLAIFAAVMFVFFTIGIGVLMIWVPYITWMVILFMGCGFFSAAYAYNAMFRSCLDVDHDELDFEEEELDSFIKLCDRLERLEEEGEE